MVQSNVIPTQSSGRYVIERELGHGGMGIVYEARDLEHNTRVALKALHKTDALNIYRLKNEFRQLADLSHPNLVTLHELCFDGDKWFFTMELVDGQTLDEYVAEHQVPLPPDSDRGSPPTLAGRARLLRHPSVTLSQRSILGEAPLPRANCNMLRLRSVMRQLVEAIAALHDAGKLHRDIKPSNVLVTPTGRVVVLDFGMVSNSTHVDPDAGDAERSVGGAVFGTPAYMSPEQAAGEPITPASDWYSVGAVLYEALTGQLPFDGTVLQILRQKDEQEPVPPSELIADVPDDLDQLCQALLRRDPQKRPSLTKLLRLVSTGTQSPPAFDASTSSPVRRLGEPFIGREPHLAKLREAFERSKSGQAATLFVHGYSGMGKSALVRAFANELIKNDEAVVLRGRCYERESVPYKAFDDIIDALSRHLMRTPAQAAVELLPRNIHALARLFPVLKRVNAVARARVPLHQTNDPRELRNQAFGALRDLLLRLSDHHPLVINIDDLQWGDVDSARLLSHLLGGPDAPPILFVGTYRREEASSSAFLHHILHEHALADAGARPELLEVNALAPDETEQLTREFLRGLPLADALFTRTIAAESEGVPFFVGELTQHVKAHAENASSALLRVSLDNVIATRVAGMSDEARRVLDVLSVAARPLEQGVVLEAAGLPAGDRQALLALRAARLIRTRGTRQTDCAETFHDRVRESVVSALGPEQVRTLHARIAHASENWGVGEPEQLVVHYAEAGDGGRAGETAIFAAHAAAEKLAFNRAAELYRKAIDLQPSADAASARDLFRHLGDALANAGRGAQAAAEYLRAAQGCTGAEARAIQRKAAQQLLRSGRIEQGLELTKTVLSQMDVPYPTGDAKVIASLVWNKLALKAHGFDFVQRSEAEIPPAELERVDAIGAVFPELGVGDPLRCALLQAQHLRYALHAGEPTRVLQGLAWEAINTAYAGGRHADARVDAVLRRASTLADQLGSPHASATAKLAHAGAYLFLGRFSRVAAFAEEAEAIFEHSCSGCSWERNLVATIRYGNIEQTGEFSQILKEAPERVREARERDDRFALGCLSLSVPLAHLMTDEPERALALLDEQRKALSTTFDNYHLWVMTRTVDTLLYMDRGAEALAHLNAQWPAFSRTFTARSDLFKVTTAFLRGRALLAASATRSSEGRRAMDACLRSMATARRPYANCLADLLRASMAIAEGDAVRARALLRRCIELEHEHQMPVFATYARRALGSIVRGEAGDKLRATADAALRLQGIRKPEPWTAVYLPWKPMDAEAHSDALSSVST